MLKREFHENGTKMSSKHVFLESYKDYTLYLNNQSNPQSAFFRVRSFHGKLIKILKKDIEDICGKEVEIKEFTINNGRGNCSIEIKRSNSKKK